jgi:large subunit ribosomal protein L9
MKVLLREDVRGIGRRGDVVEVAGGYARNFLLPSGKALKATEQTQVQSDAMRRARDTRDAQDREAAQAQLAVLSGAVIGIQARAAAGGRLFGSVGPAEIVAAIADQKGIEVDQHKVILHEHLKDVGSAQVSIELFSDVIAEVSIEVIAQG